MNELSLYRVPNPALKANEYANKSYLHYVAAITKTHLTPMTIDSYFTCSRDFTLPLDFWPVLPLLNSPLKYQCQSAEGVPFT